MFKYKILLCLVGIVVCLPFINGKKLFLENFDSENKFKYHVAVLKVLPDETTKIICGGAIIDSRYVLTAAHCIYDLQKSELLIRSGSDIAPSVAYQERRSFHKIAKITYPKDYVHAYCRHHEHDIALLKVENRFDLADTTLYKKVNLPLFDNDYDKNEAIFTGYGFHKTELKSTTEEIDKEAPVKRGELKYVNARVISNEDCKRSAPAIITMGNICTQSTNPSESSCLGDDGGPLVYDGALIGIRNSYNTKCINNEPEIYTRVSSYLKFINKVLNQENSYDIVYI